LPDSSLSLPGASSSLFTTDLEVDHADHVVRVRGSAWELWRWVALHGAGFPAIGVARLFTPNCAQGTDGKALAEREAPRARGLALEATQRTVSEASMPDERPGLRRIPPGLASGKYLLSGNGYSVDGSFCALQHAEKRLEEGLSEYRRAFYCAHLEIARSVSAVARDPQFREAITWQNRQARQTGIDAVLRKVPGTMSHQVCRHSELVARYPQRYWVNKSAIRYFGPTGWARLAEDGPEITARPGPEIFAWWITYFEGWCIDALAAAFNREGQRKCWLAPRRMRVAHLEGRILHLPMAAPIEISFEEALVLEACDGERSAETIAWHIPHASPELFASARDIHAVLDRLEKAKWIVRDLDVPFAGSRPEQTLQSLLERIDDQDLCEYALTALDMLDGRCRAIAIAASNMERLNEVMQVLDAVFARVTGVAPARPPGAARAAPTSIYEDCRHDIEITRGPDLVHALLQPLTLVLTRARWSTRRIVAVYREACAKVYAALVERLASCTADAASSWLLAQDLLSSGSRLARPVNSAYHKRWAGILALSDTNEADYYRAEDLASQLRPSFYAAGPGWISACQQPVDVIIAAASVRAMQDSQDQFVLGEVHGAADTLAATVFVAQHPSPADLSIVIDRDLSESGVVPGYSGQWLGAESRTRAVLISLHIYRLMFSRDAQQVAGAQSIASVVIEDAGRTVVARTLHSQLQFDVIEVLAGFLQWQGVHKHALLARRRYIPRVVIIRPVVHRESWCFAPAEITFVTEREGSQWSAAARGRPFCVAFASPISINILATAARRCPAPRQGDGDNVFTETLPDVANARLPDVADQRYVSEFCMVLVDPMGQS